MPGASARGGAPESAARVHRESSLRKTRSDLLFLAGLLLGGPIMTLGGRFRLGLFLVLAGGIASVLHRYSRASLGGGMALGAAAAALIAVVLVGSPGSSTADGVPEEERALFIEELAQASGPDSRVEARGPGLFTVWFFIPDEVGGSACGTVPAGPIRDRLRDLGFRRVVVADRTTQGSLCTFEP